MSARGRRILASGAATAGARVVTVLCSFVAMPICLRYLGLQGFGVWAAITSVVGLMAFADLGIGNGVLNLLSVAWGRDDAGAVRRIFATATLLLSAIGGLLFTLFLLLYGWIDWRAVFGAADPVPAGAVASAVFVLALVTAVNLPSTAIQRLQFAVQLGYLNGLSQAAGGVLSLLLVLLVSRTELGLPGMVGATLLAPLIALWISGLWLFLRCPQYMPKLQDVDKTMAPEIFRSGAQFLVLGLVFCVCQLSDNLVIANLLGADEVARFAVHQKYVSPIAFIGGLALTPLWAAYAEARARGDVAWIKAAFSRSLGLVLLAAAVLSAALLLLLEPALAFWMKGRVAADHWMTATLLLWVSIELLGKAVSIFLHGMGLVGQQVWVALVFLPTCLAAKVVFGMAFGVPGVVLGTTLAYACVHAWPYWRLVRRWHAAAPTSSQHPVPPTSSDKT